MDYAMYKNIYIIVSDFIQAVEADAKLRSLCYNWNGRRGPKRRLTITQVIALNIMRFLLHIKDLKAFHRTIRMLDLIPGLPNYENFLKASNKALPVLTLFLQALLARYRELNNSDNSFHGLYPGLNLPEQAHFQPQGHKRLRLARKVHERLVLRV